jgi:hypothetical protein
MDVALGLLLWALMIFGAPIAEELFFRGWLWTGLRRTVSPVPTALITSALWLACHLTNGLRYPLALLPAAAILSLARHYGGSVRASIALHFWNNLFAIVAVGVARVITG